MAKQAKKFQRIIKDLELQVGPVITGGSPSTGPVFVAVFGTPQGASHAEVLGSASLIKDNVVLGGPDTVAALKAGASPTMVGFAWVAGINNRTQSRSVKSFGHREGDDETSDMWAIELSSATTAPLPSSNMPDGASPASAWCFLFPWLSMCHKN